MAICPNCGGQLEMMAVKCGACGYDFPDEPPPSLLRRLWWMMTEVHESRWTDCYYVPIVGYVIGVLIGAQFFRGAPELAWGLALALTMVINPVFLAAYVWPVGLLLRFLLRRYPTRLYLILYGSVALFALATPLTFCVVVLLTALPFRLVR